MPSLNFVVSADTRNFTEGMKEVQASFEKVKSAISQIERAGASLDDFYKKLKGGSDGKEVSIKVDLSSPTEQLKKFDEQLGEFCKNIDTYLTTLKQKYEDFSSIANSTQASAPAATNADASKQIEEVRKMNEELQAQIEEFKKQVDGYKELWRELQEAAQSDDPNALKDFSEYVRMYSEAGKEVDATKEKHKNLRTEIANMRQELVGMIERGESGTTEFYNLASSAGQLTQRMKEANATMAYLGGGAMDVTFNTLKTGLQGVAGAFGLVNSVVGIFTDDQEKMLQVQTRVQSMLGIIIGLEQVYNLTKKEGVLRQAVELVQTGLVTIARRGQAAATNAATAAQEGLNAAMSANVYGAVIALLVTLGTVIYTVVEALNSETEAEKKAREEAEAAKQAQEDYAKVVGSNYANLRVEYEKLRIEWNRLKSDHEKNKFLVDNKNKINGLTDSVKDATTADNFFNGNTSNVVESFKLRAQAAASAAVAVKEYQAAMEAETLSTSASTYNGMGISEETYQRLPENLKKKATASFALVNQNKNGYSANVRRLQGYTLGNITDADAKVLASLGIRSRNQMKAVDEHTKNAEKALDKAADLQIKADKLNKIGGVSGGRGGGRSNTSAEKIVSAAELNDELLNLTKQRIDKELAAEEKGTQRWKELQTEKINLQAEIDQRAAEKAGREALRKLDASYKGGKSGLSADEYANRREQIAQQTSETIAAIAEKSQKDIKALDDEFVKAERQSYITLLKEYGDYEQQKLAITQEYEEKIAKASSPSEAAKLRLQMKDELDKLATENALQEIDWSGVFNDLEGHTKEYLTSLRDKLQALLASGEIKDLTQLASLQGKIGELNTAIASKGGMFGFTGSYATERARREQAVEDAQRRVATSEGLRMAAARNVAGLQAKLSGLAVGSPEYARVEGELKAAQLTLAKATEDNTKATQELTEAQDAANESTADKIAGTMSDANEWAQKYLGDAPALLDKLGFGEAGESLSKGLEGFNDAAGAAADFASGNYIGAVVKGISAFENFGDALFGDGGYADTVAAVEENNRIIEANSQAVSRLTEAMQDKGLTTEEARKEYEAIQSMLNQNQELARQNAQRMAGESNWRNHSWNYERNRSYFDYGAFNSVLSERGSGAYVSSAQDVLGLSAKDLDLLRTYAAEGWTKFFDQGGYFGGAEIKAEVEKVADEYKELENAQNSFIASLTNITFDALRDNFKNTLMSMEDDTAEFTDKFEEMFMSSALDAIMATMGIGDELEKWQKRWAEDLESGGGLDEEEVRQRREEYLAIVEMGKEARDLAAEITGYDPERSSRSGSRGMAQSMSQDTAEELNGRFTAFQISNEGILTNTITIVGQLSSLTAIQTGSNGYLSQIRDMMITSNGFLEEIAKYSRNMNTSFGTRLESIDNKLTNL